MRHQFEFNLFSAEALGNAATITSGACDLKFASRIVGLVVRVASVLGAADVRIEMQSSYDGDNWDNEDDWADVSSSTATDNANNTEGWNAYTVNSGTIPNRFIRFLFDELAGVADTLVDARLICEEEIG